MIKKSNNRALSLAIAMLMLMTAFAVVATGTVTAAQSGDYTYTVNGSVATVTGYTGTGGTITIPSTLGGYTVGAIGEAFHNNKNVVSVTIPNSVTTIGDAAFDQCQLLSSAVLGTGVTSIGNYSFDSDGYLVSVNLPSSLTSIGTAAFADTAISAVNIPSGVTSIGLGAFYRTTSLWSINVDPANLNYASVDGVLYNKTMTTLIEFPYRGGGYLIPNGVVTIATNAFATCPLFSVTLPNSVTTISDGAFSGCTYMSRVNIGSGVTSIGNNSFWLDPALYSVTFYGLVAPTYVSSSWLTGTALNITGHANSGSDFPAAGNVWNGLTMGAVISATPVVPGAPTGNLNIGGYAGYITLSWIPPVDVGNPVYTQFNIYRSTTSGSYGDPIGNVGASTLSYNDTTPTPGTLYYYVVKAVNTAGPGTASSEGEGQASASTGSALPSAPQGLVITNGNNQVTLSWSAPTNAGSPSFTRYDIYRGATASTLGTTPIGNVAAGTTTYVDSTAANNNTYVYVVKAVNSAGSGPISIYASGNPSSSASSNTGTTNNNDGAMIGIVVIIVLVVVVVLFLFMRNKRNKNTPPK